jgi:hypothetical protein
MKNLLRNTILFVGCIAFCGIFSSAVPTCPDDNNGSIILIPNPDDCTTYYECEGGHPVLRNCPAGLFFCKEINACTWPTEECGHGEEKGRTVSQDCVKKGNTSMYGSQKWNCDCTHMYFYHTNLEWDKCTRTMPIGY